MKMDKKTTKVIAPEVRMSGIPKRKFPNFQVQECFHARSDI